MIRPNMDMALLGVRPKNSTLGQASSTWFPAVEERDGTRLFAARQHAIVFSAHHVNIALNLWEPVHAAQ